MLVIYLSFFRFLFDAIKFVLLVQMNLSFFGSLLYSLEKNIRNAISFGILWNFDFVSLQCVLNALVLEKSSILILNGIEIDFIYLYLREYSFVFRMFRNTL